jgi:hypothetical protein
MSKVMNLFNAIEFHEAFIATMLDYIRCGNQEIRQAAA